MARCPDCGCYLAYGYCTNCDEEAYIADIQLADVDYDEPFSDSFVEKIIEGRERAKERRKQMKETRNEKGD